MTELDEVERAIGSGVPTVSQRTMALAPFDRRRVAVHAVSGIRSTRVFGDVHGRKPFSPAELHCFFGGALEVLDRPSLHEAADWARAAPPTKERCSFNAIPRAAKIFNIRRIIFSCGVRAAQVGLIFIRCVNDSGPSQR